MKKMNFLELIGEYKIVIPLIQRDYAQGRVEEIDKAVNFLEAIKKGLNTGLNLDFIYGQAENGMFTPLDGQQRLTTLFLIHWYLSLEDEYLLELEKFTYEVRSSTKDFIKELTKKSNFNKIMKKKVTNNIENSNWFFLSWKKDPTVVAILNMLDLIEERFQEINIRELSNITFEFLHLDEFNLTDELYVKMNARGKPLTRFENFKAEFLDIDIFKLDKRKKIEIASKFDNSWLDIFWNIAKLNSSEDISKAPKISDNSFYNFFENITLFFNLDKLNSVDELNLFKFKFAELHLTDIEIILDCLTKYTDSEIHDIRVINIFQDFLKPYIKNDAKQSINYEQRARFYSLIQFFLNVGSVSEDNRDIFKSWMRVNLNLINNISFNTIDDFKNSIALIDNLSKDVSDIYNYIHTISLKRESYQFQEEKLKAKLITSSLSLNWENEFIKAEKHWYLDGQIGFLLKFSLDDFDEFKEYRDKFFILFDKEKLFKEDGKQYQTLIHRALLSLSTDSYLPNHRRSDKYTFCVYDDRLRIKNENWRNVFDNDCFHRLLDYINVNTEPLLKSLVDSYEFKCNEWKSYFINPKEDWEVITFAKNYQIEKIDTHNMIYLNRGYGNNPPAEKWGWARVGELYSYYLFKKYFENSIYKSWYWINSSPETEKPCIVLDDLEFQNQKIDINIWFEDIFHIEFFIRERNINKISKNLISILSENSFSKDDDKFIYDKEIKLCDMDNVIMIIKKLFED